MPFYEYRCEQGHSFDVMQRMADDPVTSCITCEAPVQRIFHAPAVHFKGSGFYSTDYGKSGAADKGSGEASGDKGSGEGSSSSGEGAGGDAKKSDSGTKDAKKESSTASTGAASD